MRTASFVLASLLLASCGLGSGEDASSIGSSEGAPPSGAPAGPSGAPAGPSAAPAASSAEAAASEETDWFFVGRWASDVENCEDQAWVITAAGLRTPGHVACTFDEVDSTLRGAAAHAKCTAEGPPQRWTLQFSYAESARALLIEDGPFADVGLVACEATQR
jgi:hypothetical protein